jgi:medium-chain acyl-[acyl-carrier-protein] hydrolase
VTIRHPRPQARVRLFCLPYAGGGASVFQRWPDLLGQGIEICPVLLPGREERIMESAAVSMEEIIPRLAAGIAPYADRPFAFFGHSMGGLMAFELSRYLCEQGRRRPFRIMLSGCTPLRSSVRRHLLPDDALREEIRRLNGVPAEILDNQELMEIVLPILRADFTLVETYEPSPAALVPIPISVFAGHSDPIAPPAQTLGWGKYTTARFTTHVLAGDHFFLHQPEPLTRLIRQELADTVGIAPQ